jgi:hypothetical protein
MKKKIAVTVFVASVLVAMLLLKSHRAHQRDVYLTQAKICMQSFDRVFKVIDDDNRTSKAYSEALTLGIADYSKLNSMTTLHNESRREIDRMVENLQNADTKWNSSEESFRKESEDHQNEMSIAMKTMEAEIQLGRKSAYDRLALAQENAKFAKEQYFKALTLFKGQIPEVQQLWEQAEGHRGKAESLLLSE